jgi:hypothetical protein
MIGSETVATGYYTVQQLKISWYNIIISRVTVATGNIETTITHIDPQI